MELTFWQKYILEMTGGIDLAILLAAVTFATLGIILRLCVTVYNRDKESGRTPKDFSVSFFVKDNFLRVLAGTIMTLLAVLLSIRFSNELFGKPLTMFFSLGIGVGFDLLVQKIIDYFRK